MAVAARAAGLAGLLALTASASMAQPPPSSAVANEAAGDPAQLSPIQFYYLATAFSEAGEAKLAAQGAKPRQP